MEHSSATLRAALESLSDWDDALDAFLEEPIPLSPPLGISAPSADVTPSSPSKKKRCRSERIARKTEYQLRKDSRQAVVAALTAQVLELEAMVGRMKGAKDTTRNRDVLVREWEEITSRQKRQRLTVESEHNALRSVCAGQLRSARQVLRRTKKALVILHEVLGSGTTVRIANYQGPYLGSAQHLRYLDCRLDEAGLVLSSGLFAIRKQQDFAEVSFRDHGEDGLQVEFSVSWTLPFSANDVASAFWGQMLRTGHDGRLTDYELAHSSSDMVVTNFISLPDTNGTLNCNHGQPIPGVSHGQTVVRRLPLTVSGSVFMLSRIHASILDDAGNLKGDMQGDGWIQVEPLSTASTASTPAASRIRWCRRVKGRLSEVQMVTPTDRARWVNSVVTGPMRGYWEKSLARNIHQVENSLFAAP